MCCPHDFICVGSRWNGCRACERKCCSVLLKIIAPILFILSFFEMIGLGFYIDAMYNATPTACCGFISSPDNSSSDGYAYFPGADCLTSNIEGNAIDHENDTNGNIWCSVNGTRCNSRTIDNGIPGFQPINVTLNQCFNESGYSPSSLCSADRLELQSEYGMVCMISQCLQCLLYLQYIL